MTMYVETSGRPDVFATLPGGEVSAEWPRRTALSMLAARGEGLERVEAFESVLAGLAGRRDPARVEVAFLAEDPEANFVIAVAPVSVDASGASEARQVWSSVAREAVTDLAVLADGRSVPRLLMVGNPQNEAGEIISPVVEALLGYLVTVRDRNEWDVVVTASTPLMSLLASAAPYIEELVASIRVHE